jgi:uncharacterized protein (DUF983 family)
MIFASGRKSTCHLPDSRRSVKALPGFPVLPQSHVIWGRTLKTDFEQIKRVLGRCLRLRCPACGESRIVTQPFHIRHHCPNCLSLFKREDGFFVGAILANVVTTELVILVVCFFFLLIVGADYERVLVLLFVMALIFPVAFYHHSWSLWLGFDFIVESLPKYDPTKRHRST